MSNLDKRTCSRSEFRSAAPAALLELTKKPTMELTAVMMRHLATSFRLQMVAVLPRYLRLLDLEALTVLTTPQELLIPQLMAVTPRGARKNLCQSSRWLLTAAQLQLISSAIAALQVLARLLRTH